MIEAAITLARPGFALDVAFNAESGVTALFGPSGSGKTTILDAIAGLEQPDAGHIAVDGEVFFDQRKRINLAPHRRRIGYVFQDALLFPHLNVEANLRYGLRGSGHDFNRIVGLLGIGALLDRGPARLSGGERQRVAIGRALLTGPRLLLMDEPLAALDIDRKREILPYIESLRDEVKIPVLYVSHAVDEVARLANHVLVIEGGRITASGPPEVALAPHLQDGETRFERVSVLTGKAGAHDPAYGITPVIHPAGGITIAGKLPEHHEVRVVVRATDVTLALARPRELSVRTALEGRIAAIEIRDGPIAIVDVEVKGGQRLAAAVTRKAIDELGLDQGDTVWCLIKAVSIDERWITSA